MSMEYYMKDLSFFDQLLLGMFSTLLVFLTAINYAQADNTDVLQGLGQPTFHSVTSTQSQSTYHLIVRLPAEYDKNSKYPTIYLLDGGISYPLLSAYYHYLRFTEEIPVMIMVGISYGTDDWQKGNARSTDYTAKSPQREHWGGAVKFQHLLKNSIIPLIEKNYPSDPDKRLIFGNSIAGQFVLYTAMTKPELFSGYIASNPALHRNLPFFMEEENLGSIIVSKPKLFVSSGSNDASRFREPATKWMKYWEKNNKPPWILKTETFNNEGHMSAIPRAFVHGTRWILAPTK